MDANDLFCVVCKRPPQSIFRYPLTSRRAVIFEVTCHGLCCKISVDYDEIANSISLNNLVQARFAEAVKMPMPITVVLPKIQVTEAPVVLRKPQRKIDLE